MSRIADVFIFFIIALFLSGCVTNSVQVYGRANVPVKVS